MRKLVQRTPREAWQTMYRGALRFPPSRWLLSAALMPGSPSYTAAKNLNA